MSDSTDDLSVLSDRALVDDIRNGSPRGASELRRRHLHMLQTVAAGYHRADRNRDETVDHAIGALAGLEHAPNSDGEVILALFALVRTQTGRLDESNGRPRGLADLVSASGTSSLEQARMIGEVFGSLDERDQVLLWFNAVEGSLPAQLAERLSIRGADLASTMTYQAWNRFRAAVAANRSASNETTPACLVMLEDLTRLTNGSGPSSADQDRSTHLDSCDHCRALVTQLAALPTLLLSSAIAWIGFANDETRDAHEDATPAAWSGAGEPTLAAALAPAATVGLPITEAAVVPPAAFGAGGETGFDDDPYFDEDDEPRGRRAAAVVLAVIVAALVIGGVAWKLSAKSPTEPVHAGPATTFPVAPASTGIASTTRRDTSTTSSTSSTTSASSTTVERETTTVDSNHTTTPHTRPTTPPTATPTTNVVPSTAPATTTPTTTPPSSTTATTLGPPPISD